MQKYELGILDTRAIIKTLEDSCGYDFKNYALTFFKRRIEFIIKKYGLKNASGFLQKITSDKDFIEIFLKEITVETTEMFRDPSLWRYLKNDFLPKVVPNTSSFKIWFPEVSTGEELFSLAILLKELKLLDKVKFIVSSTSKTNIEQIQKGIFSAKKIETNNANFDRIFSNTKLNKYYTIKDDKAILDISLIKNTKFLKQSVIFDEYPKGIKLVICRNQMLYFNQILQERFIKSTHNCIVPGGHFIIGNNENIDYWNCDKDYVQILKSESIFKKKLS
ncbi:MAG: CheR family methyltransferase [Bacteroidota bacterium]|nr:CheR family methyltransferase [Bacteroidota bacterium]